MCCDLRKKTNFRRLLKMLCMGLFLFLSVFHSCDKKDKITLYGES